MPESLSTRPEQSHDGCCHTGVRAGVSSHSRLSACHLGVFVIMVPSRAAAQRLLSRSGALRRHARGWPGGAVTARHQHTQGTGKATSCPAAGLTAGGGKSCPGPPGIPPRASASSQRCGAGCQPGGGGQERPRDWGRGQGTWGDRSCPAATQTPCERIEPPVPGRQQEKEAHGAGKRWESPGKPQ